MSKEEVLIFGLSVFNGEEAKFKRWLIKSNSSLDGNSPQKLLESSQGIKEVRKCLNRIEYGNLA